MHRNCSWRSNSARLIGLAADSPPAAPKLSSAGRDHLHQSRQRRELEDQYRLRAATVDSYPAHIDDAKISWHDPTDGGNYTLDRKSGDLTVIVASSTGGYFLHDRCSLER